MEIQAFLRPYRFWVVDGFLTPHEAAAAGAEAAAHWQCQRTSPRWVRYANDCEKKKWALAHADECGVGVSAAFGQLRDSLLLDRLRALIGARDLVPDPSAHGAGLHVTEPGGWLSVHVDYARHPRLAGWARRLSAVLFLVGEWRPEWGGALLMCDAGGVVHEKVLPRPGRLVLFENSDQSYHGVEQTALDAPVRVSAACYYIAQARPADVRTRALFMPNRSPAGEPPIECRQGVSS